MKKGIFKRGTSLFLSVIMCLSALVGFGTTAYAAGETAEAVMISFPRDGDANYDGEWGHGSLELMNGWSNGETRYTTVYAVDSYSGNICYCIEPGTALNNGNILTGKDETFWDNYPDDYNKTIGADFVKLFIGRILQYGYTGTISTDWRSQNEGADKIAQSRATQLLIWETVVGERDENFNHVAPSGCNAVLEMVSTAHPLYGKIMNYYNSIVASVQTHSKLPSFVAQSTAKAQTVELARNGTEYTATLTDSNNVLGNYNFSGSGLSFSVNGNTLTVSAKTAPANAVTITAEKRESLRKGLIVWSDGVYVPGVGIQDLVSYTQSVNDPVKGYLNVKISYGSAKLQKVSEDGKVEGISFTVTGEGYSTTVKTNANGEWQLDNLSPGIYTVTELVEDKYEPQEIRRVTVVGGQVSTVTFNNILKRGDLSVTKTSEDGLNEGVTFHLYGISLSGLVVDEYAVTDSSGKAYFSDV
ncbi:MAG: SpaA isopeptide-forming pilin-related protein, partial [Clostridia bacterium]|nr:SpaA isopeptide-forming pilin-related protein [Clostridia bacterium]